MSPGKLIAIIVVSIVIAVALINGMLAANGKPYLGDDDTPSYQFVPSTDIDGGQADDCLVGDEAPGCQ